MQKNSAMAAAVKKEGLREGSTVNVVLLGSQSWGMGLLSLPDDERHCNVLAIVDDTRAKYGLAVHGVPVVTSDYFSTLAREIEGLVAINTCTKAAPRRYFDDLCQRNGLTAIDFARTVQLFDLQSKLAGWEPRGKAIEMRLKVRQAAIEKYRALLDWTVLKLARPNNASGGVAIVKLDGVGAFIEWQESARVLRDRYAKEKITLFCDELYADYVQTMPYWDVVVPVNAGQLRGDLGYRRKMLARVRDGAYAMAINATRRRFWLDCDSLVRASRARTRVGVAGEEASPSDGWYTQLAPIESPGKL